MLYEYDGTAVFSRVDGPWPDEDTATREAVTRWVSQGDVYLEIAPDTYQVITGV